MRPVFTDLKLLFVASGMLLSSACDSEKAQFTQAKPEIPQKSETKLRPTRQTQAAEDRKPSTSGVPDSIQAMERQNKWGDFSELNREVKIAAAERGCSYGEALEQIYQELVANMPDSRAQSIAMIFASSHGRDLDLLTSSLSTLPAGYLKKMCVNFAVGGQYNISKDSKTFQFPLDRIYTSLEESEDRTKVANAYAYRAFRDSGFDAGMSTLAMMTHQEKESVVKSLCRAYHSSGSSDLETGYLQQLLEYAKKEGLGTNDPFMKSLIK